MPATSTPLRRFWARPGVAIVVLCLISLTYYHPHLQSRWPSRTTLFPGTHRNQGPDLLEDILNSTLGFQKIYAINLPTRSDHRDALALAAHFTGLDIDIIDGVTDINPKTLPPHDNITDIALGVLGALRAHLGIARLMVENNISTALVLEDDADWDLRIRSQLQTFASASRVLIQPKLGNDDQFWDLNMRRDESGLRPELIAAENRQTQRPTTSPYGDVDRWDILWLGHCGSRFPRPSDEKIPLGRVIIADDETVPEPQHVAAEFGSRELYDEFPAHTRAVHREAENTCTLAYGMTLAAARNIIYELSVVRLRAAFDMMLRDMCEGTDGRKMRRCFTTQPQLFQHHRPVGSRASQSDIDDHEDVYNPTAHTLNLRWSTRVNFPKLVEGETDWIDPYKDGKEAPPWANGL